MSNTTDFFIPPKNQTIQDKVGIGLGVPSNWINPNVNNNNTSGSNSSSGNGSSGGGSSGSGGSSRTSTRNVYENRLDVEAYNKFVEEQSKLYGSEYQSEYQKLLAQRQSNQDRNRLVQQIESGGPDVGIAKFMATQRETALNTQANVEQTNFEASQKAKLGALQSKVESEKGRFMKRVKVGTETTTYNTPKDIVYSNASFGNQTGTYNSSTGTFTSSKGFQMSVSPEKISIPATSEQIKQFNSSGGTYVTPTGGLVSSSKSISELNKGIIQNNSTVNDFFGLANKPTGFENALTLNKSFVGQYVKVGSVGDKVSDVEKRASELINTAKISYSSSVIKNLGEQQKAQIEYNRLQTLNEIALNSKFVGKQYPVDTKTSLPFVDHSVKAKGYAPSKIEAYKPMVDISQAEYDKQIGLIESNIEKQTGFYKTVLEPNALTYKNMINKYNDGNYNEPDLVKNIFNNPVKDFVSGTYDFATNTLGFASAKANTFGMSIGDESLIQSKSEKFILPYKSALNLAKSNEAEKIQKNLDRFYMNKLVVESAGYLAGGGLATVSTIGAVSRSKNVEEMVLPFAFGVGGRIVGNQVGNVLSKGIMGVNERVTKYSGKLLIGNKPVPKDVIVPNVFKPITDAQVGRAIVLGGTALELGGMNLIPTDYKYEYIRNVGLYNAVTPIGYKVADTGIMLGNTTKIGLRGVSRNTLNMFGVRYKGKDISPYDFYNKNILMQEDISVTPTLVGNEKQMMLSMQDISKPSAAKLYFTKTGVNPKEKGLFIAVRSINKKLEDVISPKPTYYEGMQKDFFSSQGNPISMRNTGIRARLLGPRPSIYDEYQLGSSQAGLELVKGNSALGTQLKSNKLSLKAYDYVKELSGYSKSGLDKSFSKDIVIEGQLFKKGTTFREMELFKITGGKGVGNKIASRSFKSRYFIDLIGEKAWVENFGVNPSNKGFDFESSQSRMLKVTTENEVVTSLSRERIPTTNPTKLAFRKKGYADAYVWNEGELIPLNYERFIKNNSLKLNAPNQKMLSPKNLQIESNLQLEFKPLQLTNKKLLTSKQNNSGLVPSRTYNLTKENQMILQPKKPMSETDARYGLEFNAFAYTKLPVIINTKDKELVVDSKYKQKYSPNYVASYKPNYSPSYSPKYEPSYEPKYTPDYTPKYSTTYTPDYVPPYVPPYTPDYTPPYVPEYTPKYTPPYTPKYQPPYTPNYTPPYKPPYKPPYPTKYPLQQTKYEKKKGKGYLTFIRRKGKIVKISDEPLSYGLALEQGKTATRKGLSQSFFIKTFGYTKYSDTMAPNLNEYRLKKPTSKIREQVYIEKNPLATRGETNLIQQAKKSKRSLFG